MALVRDNCLVPTLDAPELGYIRDSSQEQYVPDVFYKVKSAKMLLLSLFLKVFRQGVKISTFHNVELTNLITQTCTFSMLVVTVCMFDLDKE